MSSSPSFGCGEKRKMARSKSNKQKQQSGGPIVPPPHRRLPSRKRARKMTTEFHKLLKEQQEVEKKKVGSDDDTALQQVLLQEKIDKTRADYQRASQVSTAFHSTSKWVLGVLAQNGWLYGRKVNNGDPNQPKEKSKKKDKQQRQPTKLLEIGAINTELLDAAAATVNKATRSTSATKEDGGGEHDDFSDDVHDSDNDVIDSTKPPAQGRQGGRQRSDGRRLLHVRAIDIHSMDPRIEQADFLTLPTNEENEDKYDVIVCSMVLNCGMTPQQRGDFLHKMHHFLQPDGMLFLTLPRTCLQLSPYMDASVLKQMLEHVGLSVTTTKESPKIAFFICTKQVQQEQTTTASSAQQAQDNDDDATPNINSQANNKWTKLTRIRRGKKYRNDFAIVLAPSKDDDRSSKSK